MMWDLTEKVCTGNVKGCKQSWIEAYGNVGKRIP